MAVSPLRGLKQTFANMEAELKAVDRRTMSGLMASGLKVQRLSQTRVPVEYGNLKGSAFTRKVEGRQAVQVGYTASYAVFVHEDMEQSWKGKPRASGLGVYWGPSGGPKYLENPLRELYANGPIMSPLRAHARARRGEKPA